MYESQLLLENFFNASLCVYLQPADLQGLGAVGRGLIISAAATKAVVTNQDSIPQSHQSPAKKGEKKIIDSASN